LLWIYIANATLLVNHEIDAVYWKEWDLFNIKGGITGFILLHIPLVFIILFGLVMVLRDDFWGPVMSLVMGAVGVFTFSIHGYYLKKGRPEFKTPLSLGILVSILAVSAIQLALTIPSFI
jgi:hydrogenase/urease accessory protein HupE